MTVETTSSNRVTFIGGTASGAFAGILGGLAFGALMWTQGMLPMIAQLLNVGDPTIRSQIPQSDEVVGFGLHMLISLIIGVSYGVITLPVSPNVILHLILGTVYGAVWAVLGGLVLLPLALGMEDDILRLRNDAQWMSLYGHLIYGAVLGLVFGLLVMPRRQKPVPPATAYPTSTYAQTNPSMTTAATTGFGTPPQPQPAVNPKLSFFEGLEIGVLAAIGGGLVFGAMMATQGMLSMVGQIAGAPNPVIGFGLHMLISITIGASYGFLTLPLSPTIISHFVLGVLYGVVWWVLGALVLMPLMLGMDEMVLRIGEPQWMSLVGHIVFGAVTGFLFGLLAKR